MLEENRREWEKFCPFCGTQNLMEVDQDSTVTTLAQVKVKPEAREAFLRGTRILVEASRGEPGVIRFDLNESTDQENLFLFHESFAAEDVRKAHLEASHTREWFSQTPLWLERQPVVQNLRGIPLRPS